MIETSIEEFFNSINNSKESKEYKEIAELIKEKINILNENSKYKEYLTKLKTFNNTLLASSTLLEDYIDNKVSI